MTLQKILQVVVACLFFSASFSVTASTSPQDAAELSRIIGEVHRLLDDDLYTIEEVIPGYKPPKKSQSSLQIADLENGDDNPVNWGKVITQLLRFQLSYAPNNEVRLPSFTYHYHYKLDQPETYGIRTKEAEEFEYLARSTGIKNILTGQVSVNTQTYKISLEVNPVANKDTGSKLFVREGNTYALFTDISALSYEIYHYLATEISVESKAYFEQGLLLDDVDPWAFGRALDTYYRASDHELKQETLSPFWNKTNIIPFLLFHHYIYLRGNPSSPEELKTINQHTLNLPDAAPDIRSVQEFISNAYIADPGLKSSVDEKLRLQKRHARRYPHQMDAYIELALSLSKFGASFDSVTVALQGIKLFPDHYRMQWNFGYILNQQAWNTRGHGYGNTLSARANDLFPRLQKLAHETAAISIRNNQRVMGPRRLFIDSMPSYSEEMLAAFYEAIEIDPHYESIYWTMINYAQPKWYGSEEIVKEVWELAIENNPDEEWPYRMRDRFSPNAVKDASWINDFYTLAGCSDPEDCSNLIAEIILLSLMTLAIFIALLIAHRSKRKETLAYESRHRRDRLL